MITLAITHYNRFEMVIESFSNVIDHEKISEILISDDNSNDGSYDRLVDFFAGNKKVKLFKNETTLGVYQNKKRAIELSTNPWIIIFDSDNILSRDYIDTLFTLPKWEENTAYCPDMAEPELDYKHFGGIRITKYNAANYIDQRNGLSLFNTMNNFVNKNYYLKIFEEGIEPIAADSIQIALLYLQSGGALYIVENLKYFHRVHKGSHYVNFTHKSDVYHKQITEQIRKMK